MPKKKKTIKEKIICWFKGHDWEIVDKRMERGWLFGQMCEAHLYACQRCGKQGEWTITETLSI